MRHFLPAAWGDLVPGKGQRMAEASRSIPKHCAGARQDGRPCTARVLGTGAYCFTHDPARQADRQAARARGGRNRGNARRAGKLVPSALRPVLDTLLAAVDEVRDGGLTTQQAGALAALAGAIVRVYQAGTLEERLAALEAAQAAQEGRGA